MPGPSAARLPCLKKGEKDTYRARARPGHRGYTLCERDVKQELSELTGRRLVVGWIVRQNGQWQERRQSLDWQAALANQFREPPSRPLTPARTHSHEQHEREDFHCSSVFTTDVVWHPHRELNWLIGS